jgi:hypothetical protein
MTHRRRRRRRRRLPGAPPPPRTAALWQHVEALRRQPNRDHRVRVTAGAAVAAAVAAAAQPDRVLDGEAAVSGGAPHAAQPHPGEAVGLLAAIPAPRHHHSAYQLSNTYLGKSQPGLRISGWILMTWRWYQRSSIMPRSLPRVDSRLSHATRKLPVRSSVRSQHAD